MDYSDFRESERQGWSDRAHVYEHATAKATTQSIPALLAAVHPFHGARLLDVGCGLGYVAGAATALSAKAKGLDFSAEMVEAAKLRFPEIPFEVGDAENLTDANCTYDAVASNIVLFHITNPMKAIKEAFRVLKPNCYFAFSQWCAPSESALYEDFLGILSKHADMSKAEAAPDAFTLSDRTKVADMFEEAGFEEFVTVDVPNILRAPATNFYDFFMQFGVRIPLILSKQEAAVQKRIRHEVNMHFERYRVQNEIHVPMPSMVYSGKRPI